MSCAQSEKIHLNSDCTVSIVRVAHGRICKINLGSHILFRVILSSIKGSTATSKAIKLVEGLTDSDVIMELTE